MSKPQFKDSLIKTELERILAALNDCKILHDKETSVIGKFAQKLLGVQNKKDVRFIKDFLINYYLFLGDLYSNNVESLYSKSMRKKLIKSVAALKSNGNPNVLRKIPKAIVDVINTKHTINEINEMVKDIKKNEKEEDKFKNSLNVLVGKQIGCINRSLCLHLNGSSNTHSIDILSLLTEEVVKLIDFINNSSIQEIEDNYQVFFETEENYIEKKEIEISKKIGRLPSLKNAYFNYGYVYKKIDEKFYKE